MAPSFDAELKQLTSRADQHKGMISNPWVKHWAGAGPAPTANATAAPQGHAGQNPPSKPKIVSRRPAGAHKAKSTHRSKK
jgi:hypothetical protein